MLQDSFCVCKKAIAVENYFSYSELIQYGHVCPFPFMPSSVLVNSLRECVSVCVVAGVIMFATKDSCLYEIIIHIHVLVFTRQS